MASLDYAIELAARHHSGQVDKGGAPYILHPLRVMMRVQGDEARIAAVLHDVVEDCGVSPLIIRAAFGDVVGDAVDALTRGEGESYGDFIERCARNPLAREVKLADLADNLDTSRLPTITDADERRIKKYRAAVAGLEA